MKNIFILLAILFMTWCASAAKEQCSAVAVSRVIRVVDGDTFVCDIDEFPPIVGKAIAVRLRNIDTPELKNKNPGERQAAYREKQRLHEILGKAEIIQLINLRRDKYFRIDADVIIDGKPLLPLLNQLYVGTDRTRR